MHLYLPLEADLPDHAVHQTGEPQLHLPPLHHHDSRLDFSAARDCRLGQRDEERDKSCLTEEHQVLAERHFTNKQDL